MYINIQYIYAYINKHTGVCIYMELYACVYICVYIYIIYMLVYV